MRQSRIWNKAIMFLFIITIISSPVVAIAADGIDLRITIRDFKADGVLFDSNRVPAERGLVEERLGVDKKPVLVSQRWLTLCPEYTQANLDALFNDVAGINLRATKALTLLNEGNGYYSTDPLIYNGNFFPIDNELFGNEGRAHNFHFTTELHASFIYQGFEELEFTSDDDGWVFIDNKLVIDRGGLNSAGTPVKILLPDFFGHEYLNMRKNWMCPE